ncbi:hypothetical protein BJF83_06375 [Nocardiopsis sp. CNR-923]|nr:hypothetical protein BJF83_06375 [Nocardiopsis sp. CNR-923]
MTVSALDEAVLAVLSRLCDLGVELSERDGRLRADPPPGVDPALLPERSPQVDAELLDLLRAAGAGLPEGTRVLPLSWTQQRMYFASHQHGAESNSTVPHALRLRGPLDVAALTEALRRLVAHHAMLRASILTIGAQVVQSVAPEAAPELPLTDLTDIPPPDREAQALRRARHAMAVPFDLARAPLIRPSLLRLAPDDHILLMPIHHLVVDGLSLPVINRTLLAAYEEAVEGRPPSQDPPRSDYRAHIADQFGERATARVERHHAYWEKRMAGKPPLLSLPTDRPRPSVPSFRGRPVEHRLTADLTAALARFARTQHITPFMLYSAALHVLLARYSGQDDITVGYPFSGRVRPEQADVVGLHITTLLQRVQLGDDPSVVELLARVRKEILTGTGHHQMRFDRLVNALGLSRSTAYHPVFQVLIGYNGPERPLPETAGLRPELYIVDTGAARFDLELYLRPDGDEMAVMLWAQEDLFETETARRMLNHLEQVLRGMLTDPDGRVSRVALLSEEEATQARTAGTGARREPVEGTVPEQIARTAHRHPDRVAVRGQGVEVTYAELDRRASAAAGRLRALGVGTEDVVGVYAERSTDLVVAIVGILRSGGAWLPLDPSLPRARLDDMVEDARPRAVVTDASAALRRDGPVPLALADLTAEGPAVEEAPDPPEDDALAYVIFTSGSTGRPKGVMNTHAGLSNRLAWMQRAYPIDGADTVLHKTPLSFDVSVWELLWPLTVGATLAVAGPGAHRDAERLGHIIRSEGVTVVHFVPSMLRAFLASGQAEACTGLRHVVCSGEALTPELRDSFGHRSDAELHNLYGPTEAAIDVTAHDLGPGGRADQRDLVPIGRPISGLSVHVLDPHGQLLPPGVTGEIHIGGVGLARGYIGRPELTAERFVPSRLGDPGERLYRTGDLGRRLADGTIEFLGRDDDQVKLRGFRIELGEVEAAIGDVPGVGQAVAALHRGPSGASSLAAYLTCVDDAEETLSRVRAALAARLPEHMVPTLWTVLAEFPLLTSGKVDRSALPDPQRPHHTPADGRERPWTVREELLAHLWERVLATPPGGLDDDFFLLGGDSILSIELVAVARQAGLGLTVEDVFQNPTLASMAQVDHGVDPAQEGDAAPFALFPDDLRDRVPTGVEDAFPLSRLLAGLYYESIANPDHRVYTTTLRLEGAFDEDRCAPPWTRCSIATRSCAARSTPRPSASPSSSCTPGFPPRWRSWTCARSRTRSGAPRSTPGSPVNDTGSSPGTDPRSWRSQPT